MFSKHGLIKARACLTATLVFLSLCLSDPHASMLLDKIVAIVNKEVITWSELYRSMEFDAIGEVKSLGEAEKKKIFKESEALFLEGMIDRRLQIQAARALDIDAGKEEIAEAINEIKKKYAIGDREFEESLKKEGFSLEEYKRRLADQIILSKVVGQQVRNKIIIAEEDIKEYMAKNRDASYRLRQIFFRKTEKGLDRKALETKANEVFQMLKSGESFPLLAMKFSEDPSGKTGGDLGFIKKQHLSREFIDALSMMNAGEISQPFWTDRGVHIIKLEEKIDTTNMDELKEIMKKKLFEQRFNEAHRNWVRGLREKAFIEIRL